MIDSKVTYYNILGDIKKLQPYLHLLDWRSEYGKYFSEVLGGYSEFLEDQISEVLEDPPSGLDKKIFSKAFQNALNKEIKAILAEVEAKFEIKTKKIKTEHSYLEEKKN